MRGTEAQAERETETDGQRRSDGKGRPWLRKRKDGEVELGRQTNGRLGDGARKRLLRWRVGGREKRQKTLTG